MQKARAVMAMLMPNVISPTPWHACMARPAAPVLGPHSPPKMSANPPNSKMRRTMSFGAARGLGSTALAAAESASSMSLDVVHVVAPPRLYKRDDVGGDGHVISK